MLLGMTHWPSACTSTTARVRAHSLDTPLGFCWMAPTPEPAHEATSYMSEGGKWRAEYATSYLKPRDIKSDPGRGFFSIISKSHWEPNGLLYTGTKSSSRYYYNSSVKFGVSQNIIYKRYACHQTPCLHVKYKHFWMIAGL